MTTATRPDRAVQRGAAQAASRDPFVTIGDRRYYAVRDVDRMAPFLMSIVSDGDRWMFVSSTGALTAGRRDVRQALFPYETDDRLHLLGGFNGASTAIRFAGRDRGEPWRPITGPMAEGRSRNLFKSVIGDSVIFEEHDSDSGLTFSYRWATSDRFGFVRTAWVVNDGDTRRVLDVVDGLRSILPYGLDPAVYLPMGNLTHAYKRSELVDPTTRLAVYSLESMVSDRPEPSQALRATTTWSTGLDGAEVLLLPDAVFDVDAASRSLATGVPGAYFLRTTLDLEPGARATWSIVADVGLDQADVTTLVHELRQLDDPKDALDASTASTARTLVEIMARADALQRTGDEVATAHHFSDVTYNVMRGGVPMDGYVIDVAAFARFLGRRNRHVAARHRELLASMDASVRRVDLIDAADRSGDVDLQRLSREYLPFSFSRRHGDPSRPWNAFSIRTTDDAGNPVRYFEGNWRDIFQNWEAMAASFPEYLPGIISVFVDASTPDGFNPYRITSDGIDWEVPEPENPWSNIGYWGDHQIVYLHRLLEASDRYLPGAIGALLGERRFTYANVPYRIAPYERILDDPKSTITYDDEAADAIAARVEGVGADGRLLWREGSVYHVTLAEKLLVPALAKLANFIPGGGIWMNTQRPEWNDANNALVGHGVSMVTLYQLRSYLAYVRRIVDGSSTAFEISEEVASWLDTTVRILSMAPVDAADPEADRRRKQLMDELGSAYSSYRRRVYDGGFTWTRPAAPEDVIALCDVALTHLDATIATARRDDGLYDSYNLIHFSDDGEDVAVVRLGEMLEGQVAVIESGVLGADECADVVDALFSSAMYRADQHSFMLYPARDLPSFLERNIVPEEAIRANPLLAALLEGSDGAIITRDADGRARFGPDLSTRADLERRLERLGADPAYAALVAASRVATVRTYEEVFGHHAYTGRSGSMYGYEGVGSIYWHMVAKLLVAIQEVALRCTSSGADPEAVTRLVSAYWDVRAGLGFNKTPAEHGAIPIDPYSHTPAHAGAQQPGMTGLVKEEILVRPAELGVVIADGEITFDPLFLGDEALEAATTWPVLDASLTWREVELPEGSTGSTVCQVPIVVTTTDAVTTIEAELADGSVVRIEGASLGPDLSAEIFARTGAVTGVRALLHTDATP